MSDFELKRAFKKSFRLGTNPTMAVFDVADVRPSEARLRTELLLRQAEF